MRALYADGDCLGALELGQESAPLAEWPGLEGRLLAGCIAVQVGAPKLGALVHLKAFRANRNDPDAQYYYLFHLQQRRGALAAWTKRQQLGCPTDADEKRVADYHGQSAQILGALRDFDAAETHLRNAYLPSGERPYWLLERAELYGLEDRYDDALAAAREALAFNPHDPSAIVSTAQFLQALGRDEEALDLLRSAATEVRTSSVVAYLIRILMRRQLLDEVPAALERFELLTPLREKDLNDWLDSTRADVAVRHGNYSEAMGYIERIDRPYFVGVARSIRAFLEDPSPRPARRVELDVPFVRQHHFTCAPATLTAISRFWNMPAEHLSVAEEICYDGTPDYSERHWANTNGWATREFCVDWASATALIDRGIPFTLTLSDVASGHLCAVMGYDAPLRVLLCRDPSVNDALEINADELFTRQASTGPRGMVMIPRERAHLLDSLRLPDADLYDVYHDLQIALERHDRDHAASCRALMQATDPGHRLTHTASRALASYDGNPHEALAAVNALLALFPDDQRLNIAHLESLRYTATREERLAWLDAACRRPGSDPLLWVEYAAELAADDRRLGDALRHARRALRRRPDNARVIHGLADLEWLSRRHTEAVELYRFAACVGSMREDSSLSYFAGSRWIGKHEAGIEFLRARFDRAGGKSAGPAMTLFQALELLDRTAEAFDVLHIAVQQRPDDGDLRLFAANRCARYGFMEDSASHLEAAERLAKRSAWLAEAARAAAARGDREAALRSWREIVQLEPLNSGAHNMIAVLIAETSTRGEAMAHLRAVCGRFPHHAGLHRLLYHWTMADPAAMREPVLRTLIAIDPADAWAMRELAFNLDKQSRSEDALRVADEAIALDRNHADGYRVRGFILAGCGRPTEAVASYREAIMRSAECAGAIHGLVDVSGGALSDRMAALQFVQEQLARQSVVGEGVVAYHATARGVLTPDELLQSLRQLHETRPDLWQVWSVLTRHLVDLGRTDEALEIIQQATGRFSRSSRLLMDLGMVHRARLDLPGEMAALRRCRELDPDAIEPVLSLAAALERNGDVAEAVRLLEAGIAREPLVPALRIQLARIVGRRGEAERAVAILRDALRFNPESDRVWEALDAWFEERGEREQTLEVARATAHAHPDEVQSWIRLAQFELRANDPRSALRTLDRALALNPQNEAAYDLRAAALAGLRRFPEARAACDPPALRDGARISLQGRGAWIEAQCGDLTAAIERMEAVVAGVPDYEWGWGRLVEWHATRGDAENAVAAATRLAWLDPQNVVAQNWIGQLRLKLGDRASAKSTFQRAMRLEPGNLFAGLQYVTLLTQDRDCEEAERAVAILAAHVPAAPLLVARVQIALARGSLESALNVIRDACADPSVAGASLSEAVNAIPATYAQRLDRTLREALHRPTWNPALPEVWAGLRANRGKLAGIRQYRWLAAAGDPGKAAIATLLAGVGGLARQYAATPLSPIGWYLDVHLLLIRYIARRMWSDDFLWGRMGYALISRGHALLAARWMRDWRTRQSLEPWMLQNLALALLKRRRDAHGLEVVRHAASVLSDKADIGDTMRLWATLGACLEGNLALAARLLDETPEAGLTPDMRPVRAFAATFLHVLGIGQHASALTTAQRAGLDALDRRVPRDWATARLTLLARARIARALNDYWMRVGAWRDLHPVLSVIVTILALTTAVRLLALVAG